MSAAEIQLRVEDVAATHFTLMERHDHDIIWQCNEARNGNTTAMPFDAHPGANSKLQTSFDIEANNLFAEAELNELLKREQKRITRQQRVKCVASLGLSALTSLSRTPLVRMMVPRANL